MDMEFLKTALVTLFVAVDPPGLAAIFLALTSHMSAADRKSTAYHSVLVATGVLCAMALIGQPVLEALGISMPAFRIAGGLLLFYIAAEMVFEKREQRKGDTAEQCIEKDHFKTIATFPLAIPLMAGPGAITATIIQASNTGGELINLLALFGVLLLVMGSCLLVFLMAGKVDKLLGMTGRIVLSRLLGLLLAALAVQIVGDGVMAFARPS